MTAGMKDEKGSQNIEFRASITANSSGVMSAEIRYYPWGTERYTYGTTPTGRAGVDGASGTHPTTGWM